MQPQRPRPAPGVRGVRLQPDLRAPCYFLRSRAAGMPAALVACVAARTTASATASAASAPITVMSAVPFHRPVAREKIVSPSPLVCDGAIALAYPSSAISAMRAASAFDNRAFVATTPIVVFSPARDCVFPPARKIGRAHV